MIVVLLGPPGSGKGTQAKKLWLDQKWPQVSTGDMLRNAISQGSKLGQEAKRYMTQGALVPDEVVVGLIAERSTAADCKNGFILDGFPRNIAQAEVLDRMLTQQGRSVDKVVLFEIPDEDLIRRLSGRRTCIQCGTMFHVENAAPRVDGICDQCGSKLVQREDDQTEVVKRRLAVYHQQTEPLVGFYRKQKKLESLDASQSAPKVTSALSDVLK